MICTGREEVEKAGQPLHLTHTEFQLLAELAADPELFLRAASSSLSWSQS